MNRCTFSHKPFAGEAGVRTPARAVAVASLALVLLVTLFVAPALAAFPDVPQGHDYYTAIEGMAARQIIGGYGDGTFGPGEPVLRAQFAKMIDGTMGLQVTEGGLPLPPFTDMGSNDPTSLYPHDYVAAAFWANITTGTTATTFAPWVSISRAQMITMAVRAANSLKPSVLDPVPADFHPTIPFFSDIHSPTMNQAESNGLLAGLVGFSSSWDPSAEATRGECAQVLWNLINKMEGPAPAGGPFPTFAELKPTAPIGYTLALDLSDAKAAVQVTGGVGQGFAINDMTVTGHLTLQIVSVNATEATLRIVLDQVTLPDDFADTDLSGFLPLVLTVVVNERGSVQAIDYSSGAKPVQHMNAQQIAQVIPLLAPLAELLFVPNFSQYEHPGQSIDTSRSYSVPGGSKVVDVAVHSTFESLSAGVAVLSYSMAVTNINTTVIADIMPLLVQFLGTTVEPGHTAILVFGLTGKITSTGRLDIDTATGLPVAIVGANDLELHAAIQQAPPDLMDLVPGFGMVKAVALDAQLGVTLDRK